MTEKHEEKSVLGSRTLGELLKRRKDGTLKEIFDDWKWILRFTKKYFWAVLTYAFLGILSASLGLLSAVASKYTIDIITGYQTSKLAIVIAIMIGSALASLGLTSLTTYVSARISIKVNNDVQAEVFSSILESDWLSLNKYNSGDLLNRFNNDAAIVAGNSVKWLPDIVIGLYTFLATFFVIWHYDHVMALIALASAPVLILSSKGLLSKMRKYNQRMKELNSDLMTYEAETFYNLDTIKSFGLAEKYNSKLLGKQEVYRTASLEYTGLGIKINALLSMLGSIVRLAIFCYCLYLLWTGKIIYGTMTLFISQGTKLSSTFNKLVSVVPEFLTSSVSAHRIKELQQMEKEPRLNEYEVKNAEEGISIKTEKMSFAYNDKEILTDAEFKANPREIVALVGPSGEGKTTMIRLILGMIRPGQGGVYLETNGGEKIPANAEMRQYFSYVPQGNTIFTGTIADNLRMVKENASDEELEDVLKAACVWDFVSELPKGINSTVGERGRGLSEGQSQRIAIARAMLRDAPVLLLDEATSALDADTERQVLKNIMDRSPNKTCIITTHRPSVLSMCNRIYKVDNGELKRLPEEKFPGQKKDF